MSLTTPTVGLGADDQLRVVIENDVLWFCIGDIAKHLNYNFDGLRERILGQGISVSEHHFNSIEGPKSAASAVAYDVCELLGQAKELATLVNYLTAELARIRSDVEQFPLLENQGNIVPLKVDGMSPVANATKSQGEAADDLVSVLGFDPNDIRRWDDPDTGEQWLVGIDVAEKLEYSDADQAISSHCVNSRKASVKQTYSLVRENGRVQKIPHKMGRGGHRGDVWVIDIGDFKQLVDSSTKSTAKAIKEKFNYEIFPQIARTGEAKVIPITPATYGDISAAEAKLLDAAKELAREMADGEVAKAYEEIRALEDDNAEYRRRSAMFNEASANMFQNYGTAFIAQAEEQRRIGASLVQATKLIEQGLIEPDEAIGGQLLAYDGPKDWRSYAFGGFVTIQDFFMVYFPTEKNAADAMQQFKLTEKSISKMRIPVWGQERDPGSYQMEDAVVGFKDELASKISPTDFHASRGFLVQHDNEVVLTALGRGNFEKRLLNIIHRYEGGHRPESEWRKVKAMLSGQANDAGVLDEIRKAFRENRAPTGRAASKFTHSTSQKHEVAG